MFFRAKKLLASVFSLACFYGLVISCSTPQQNLLNRKWYLTEVVTNITPSDSIPAMTTETIRTEGSTDFFDFSDGKNYTAQLMGDTTNGTYQFNKMSKQIIRHNETTNSIDTIDVKKLTKDTLVLYEKENMLKIWLVAKK